MRPSERPSNNKLKLTSFASLDGFSLQLNLVLCRHQSDRRQVIVS